LVTRRLLSLVVSTLLIAPGILLANGAPPVGLGKLKPHVSAPVKPPKPALKPVKLAPVKPKPAPVKPKPAPVKPKPAPVKPKPAPVKPKPAPVKPKPAKPAPNKLTFGFAGGTVSFGSKPGSGIITNNPLLTKKTSTKGKASTLNYISSIPNGKSFSGSMGSVLFSTGFALPGATSKLISFAPGGSISILSSKKLGTGVNSLKAGSILFSGFFSGIQQFSITKGTCKLCFTGLLTGDTKATFINPSLLALLGLPPLAGGTFKALEFDISLKLQGGGVQSGGIVVTPEPGSLFLTGTGLMTLAGLIRRRLTQAA
jgi:hypothetical protein